MSHSFYLKGIPSYCSQTLYGVALLLLEKLTSHEEMRIRNLWFIAIWEDAIKKDGIFGIDKNWKEMDTINSWLELNYGSIYAYI